MVTSGFLSAQGERAADSPAVTLAIVGGTLIDGTGAAPRPDVTVLVMGERIGRIGPRDSTGVPDGAKVVRAEGKFILPGFIDAHIHYRDYYPELLMTHGITSVADWGGSPIEWILVQREGISKGKIYGPRIYTPGEIIGSGEGSESSGEITVDAAVRRVRELAARGVNKIDMGFDTPPEVVKAVIQESHRLSLPVSGYPVHTREAIEAGIDAIKHTYTVGDANVTDPAKLQQIYRQATIPERRRDPRLFLLGDHYDDLVRLMVARKVAWVPTLVKDFKVMLDRRDEFERENLRLLSDPNLQYIPVQNMLLQLTNVSVEGLSVVASGRVGTLDRSGPDYELFRQGYRNLQGFIRALVQSGGHVLAGTAPHSFVMPGLSLHQEMRLFVEAGLTPMQALQSASLWVAEYLRVQKDIGSVEEGKFADIVILAKNPLEDIRNTRTVETVIQGGRVLPTGYHRFYANPIPRNTQQNAPGAGNPRAELQRISPLVTTEGSPDLALAVRGRRFVPGAEVVFETIPVQTEFVSDTELSAVIPERLLRSVGTYWIHVSNPEPGGGSSAPASLIVKFK